MDSIALRWPTKKPANRERPMEPYETPVERARRRVIEAERRVTAQLDVIAELTRSLRDTADAWAELQGLCDQLRHARAELEQQSIHGDD